MRCHAVHHMRQSSWAVLGRHFRSVCALRHFDLYHEPNFIPLPADCPTVSTLHDLSVLLHPEWHPPDRVFWFERQFPAVMRRCVHFLTISDFGRQEVIRKLHVPPQRVTRVYMGIRPGLAPLPVDQVPGILKRLGLPPRYLLHVGTIEPRKNVHMLMQAYCTLPERIRSRWPLVLAGGWGWNMGEAAEYFHSEARHRGVLHLGYLADEYLVALYNGARATPLSVLVRGFRPAARGNDGLWWSRHCLPHGRVGRDRRDEGPPDCPR